MKTAHEIHDALSQIEFDDIEQYLFETLTAFQIPNSTVTRLVKGAKEDGFSKPLYIYKRAVIYYSTLPIDADSIVKAEEETNQQYRLVLIIHDEKLVCKDLVTEEIIEFKPADIGSHFNFFLPLIFGKQKDKDLTITGELTELVAGLFTNLTLDIKNVDKTDEVINYILGLVYVSFGKTFLKDDGIELFFKNIYKFQPLEPNEVLRTFMQALTSSEDRSLMYQGLPYLGKFEGININVPHLSDKSFELSANVICYDVSNVNAEVLSSLIYKFTGTDENTGIYGHLTTANNVLKVLTPLYINKYEKLIEDKADDAAALRAIKQELISLTFFDPTNGPGCFLAASFTSVKDLVIKINELIGVNNSYEIEINKYTGLVENARLQNLSRLTLWLSYIQYLSEVNHRLVIDDFKKVYDSINIVLGKQLSQNWDEVCPNDGNVLVIGSPIYKGAKKITSDEKKSMQDVFGTEALGDADYSSCWLFKAAEYIQGTSSQSALVITNSVCQGAQVSFLWPRIYKLGVEISFAYRSFKWKNSTKHSTGVTVIILGLKDTKYQDKYKSLFADNRIIKTEIIGPYLIDSTKSIVTKRTKPFSSQLPDMPKGNMPYDSQHLLLDKYAKDELLEYSPNASKFLKRIVGSDEFISNIERWCIWVPDQDLDEANSIPAIKERIDRVREFRLSKSDKGAQKLGLRPHQFREFRSSDSQTLVIPAVSSENRPYIPIGFIGKSTVVSNLAFAIYNCEPWVFGIISSRMHMAWIRSVCGSHETRLRYSSRLGYNTFPLPPITDEKKSQITSLVFDIISERENYCDRSLGDIYSNLPERLRLLHELLDKEVESCYRQEPFNSDVERIKLLLNMYDKSEV